MRVSRRKASPPILLAIALALVAGACGGKSEDPVQIGLKRIALDLAFKGEDKDEAKPPPAQALVPLDVPSQAEFAVVAPREEFKPLPPPRRATANAPACAKAGESAVPFQPVPLLALKPPTAGVYGTRRQGTFAIEGGLFPVRGPMPPKGQKTIANVQTTTPPPNALGEPQPSVHTYEISEQLADNITTRTLRINSDGVDLMKQVTKTRDGEATFTPTPPVRLFAFGAEGFEWRSAGTDVETRTSMVVLGLIEKREWVDLCGTVYDTYRASSSERVVNLTTGYSSVTNDTLNDPATGGTGKPNYYNVANHHGGLFIREEIHTTTQAGAVTIKLDYTTTFDDVKPGTK